MSKKTIGIVLIVLGVIIVVVSLAADPLGIGSGNGIGWRQQLGTVIGAIVALVGVWQVMTKPNQKK